MGQVLHGCARTTEAVRRAIQHSQESLRALARRLKTLKGLTPYEFICKCWSTEPERFTIDPIHQMPGPYT